MKKNRMIPDCGAIPNLRCCKLAVGAKQLKKAVKAENVLRVYLAENADPALTMPLEALCTDHQIQITWVASMQALGSACGIEVGAAAAAVLKN